MRLTTIVAIVFTTCASAASATSLTDLFSSYIALGDSLTDDGKLVQQAPPSFEGRFSNGRTYAEIIADQFAVAENLALGGATAGDVNANQASFVGPAEALFNAFGTLNRQIDTLEAQVSIPGVSAALGSTPLISVFFGANDLLQNLGSALAGVEVGRNTANLVGDGVRRIAGLNPNFDTFLLLNLPNLANTPLFSSPANPESAFAPLAFAETNAFNEELGVVAQQLRNEGLTVIEFDVDAVFQQILSGAVDLGISDLTGQCIADFTVFDASDSNCSFVEFDPTTGLPVFDLALADDLLFVDSIHPNRVAQSALADFATDRVLAAVPLPAGLPLLLAGLGMLVVVRRRQRV